MTVAELREVLTAYPDDMEVVLDRMEYDDSEHIYDTEFYLETNENDQLVIDWNEKEIPQSRVQNPILRIASDSRIYILDVACKRRYWKVLW